MVKRIYANNNEKLTHDIIREVCENCGADVYPKIRVADVLEIEGSGISSEEYSYALKAHFDFVVCELDTPIFAVEFDGESHRNTDQRKRDELKNKLCEKFGFPLLRITSNYLQKKYRHLTLLEWCIESWFCWQSFCNAQEQGIIPLDEIFDMSSIVSNGSTIAWPYNLYVDINNEIYQLDKDKNISHFSLSIWIGEKDSIFYGLGSAIINKEKAIIVRSSITAKQFPIDEADLLDAIIYRELWNIFKGGNGPFFPLDMLKNLSKEYEAKYNFRCLNSLSRLIVYSIG